VKLDSAVLDRLRIDLKPQAYLRVTPLKHASTPLGMGYGETRFASPSKTFKVLYLARTLVTGVAETVVRDRFVAKARRLLTIEEIEAWGVTACGRKFRSRSSTFARPDSFSLAWPATLSAAKATRPAVASAKLSMRRRH